MGRKNRPVLPIRNDVAFREDAFDLTPRVVVRQMILNQQTQKMQSLLTG